MLEKLQKPGQRADKFPLHAEILWLSREKFSIWRLTFKSTLKIKLLSRKYVQKIYLQNKKYFKQRERLDIAEHFKKECYRN
jgi:hypothetical protein